MHKIKLAGSTSPWGAFQQQYGGVYPKGWAAWLQKQKSLKLVAKREYPEIINCLAEVAGLMGLRFVPLLFTSSNPRKPCETAFLSEELPHILISPQELCLFASNSVMRTHMEYTFVHELQHGFQPDFQQMMLDIGNQAKDLSDQKRLVRQTLQSLKKSVTDYYVDKMAEIANKILDSKKSIEFSLNAHASQIEQIREYDSDLAYAELTGDYEAAMIQVIITRILLTNDKEKAETPRPDLKPPSPELVMVDILDWSEIIALDRHKTHPSSLERIIALASVSKQENGDNWSIKDEPSAKKWVERTVEKNKLVKSLTIDQINQRRIC